MQITIPSPAASRRSAVDPFRAMDVLAEANRMTARGEPVISLAVGQPSAPAPARAVEAARAMLDHGRIAYTDALGRTDLRERLSRHYAESYGRAIGPERIMITTGSSAGFNLAFLAAFDAGDRVAIASPGYPAYRNILKALCIEPVEIEVGAPDRYLLTADRLAEEFARRPFQGVLIASPANPTGTVMPREELRRITQFCDERGLHFISDEIYHGLVYGAAQDTALAFSDRPIVVNSFSKFYCMTGWRIGWMVLPPHLVRAAERIGQSLYISAPELSQVAATAVLDAVPELERVRDGYVANRDLLTEALPRLGFRDIAPIDGAFYAYGRIPAGRGDSTAFARELLERCHVAITPGIDFDSTRGIDTVRLSYAGAHDSIAEAVARLSRHLGA